jgi:hypothetical protein
MAKAFIIAMEEGTFLLKAAQNPAAHQSPFMAEMRRQHAHHLTYTRASTTPYDTKATAAI